LVLNRKEKSNPLEINARILYRTPIHIKWVCYKKIKETEIMTKKNGILAGIVVIVIALGVGYWYVLGPSAAPSAPIEAIPLEPAPTQEVVEVEPTDEPTSEPTEAPVIEPTEPYEVAEFVVEVAEATEVPVVEPTVEPTPEPTEVVSNPITWAIDTEQSTARFELDEDLQGVRTKVVGVANQLAGQIRFDPADLSTAQIGTLQVNARTFVTDNNNRNRAIQNRILQTGDHEFVTFEPTGISGIPDSVAVGETIEFAIEGNLTVRGETNPVVFSAVVTYVDENTIEGTVASIVTYADFGINIPQVDFIANVEEELEIYIDFLANPVE
jgi:polyisoprenoid-binding protein YceI